MNKNQVQKLKHGVYEVFWKSGGSSVCAIGSKHNGDRWICCSNWTSPVDGGTDSCSIKNWKAVDHVVLIQTQRR